MKKREFNYTDKIYARLLANGKEIAHYVLYGIGSMSDLLCELHHLMRSYRGLVKLIVRNASQGWSHQQPLMLYANRYNAAAEATTPRTAYALAPGTNYASASGTNYAPTTFPPDAYMWR